MSPAGESAGLLEHLVFEIAQGVSGATGENFFRSLARSLARALDADYVLIGALAPSRDRISTLAAWGNGADVDPFEYELAGTPCANVVAKQLCSYPSGVRGLFPQDPLLRQMDIEGYVGSPMMDSSGRCLGLICALTRRPLASSTMAEALLQIFATRAVTELERKNYEEALTRSDQRLRALVSHGTEAVVRVEFDEPIPLDLPEDQQIELIYRHGYVSDCNEQAIQLFGFGGRNELVGARLDEVTPRSEPGQMDRLRAGIRSRWQFSQVEREFRDRSMLITRHGKVEEGKLYGGWITARDITELKQAEAEVRRLNVELQRRVEELTVLKSRLEQDNAYLLDEIRSEHNFGEMIGSSARFLELAERIRLVARTSATVLITGETGTGKELVARAIHGLSPRHDRPLVKINCAAISAGLVESELFGHVKGAFTGATERRIGRFEYANGGTLFLDEVTELPLESQAKLLRVLQEQEFEPVGSNRSVKVDVRLLAATNRSLSDAVREGRFRMDLYYRLQVVPVDVPPLRERREDIPALAAHFVARLSRQFGRRIDRISEDMLRQMIAYDWPGNVRELENHLAEAIVLCQGTVLDLPLRVSGPAASMPEPNRTLEETERRHIEKVLASTGWVLEGPRGAAEILKINPSTLRSRMKRLSIHRPV